MEEESKIQPSQNQNQNNDNDYEEYPEAYPPTVGEPQLLYFIPGITSENEKAITNILSFLPIKDLINASKINRYTYRFVQDIDKRTQILCWNLDKCEEKSIKNYLIRLTTDEQDNQWSPE